MRSSFKAPPSCPKSSPAWGTENHDDAALNRLPAACQVQVVWLSSSGRVPESTGRHTAETVTGNLEMAAMEKELKFLATPEKGETSSLLIRPKDATHLLVLGHGASTNMRHANLQTIAERLADVGIA